MKTVYLGKTGSQVIAKKGYQPMRFQCSLTDNISLIDEYLTLSLGTWIGFDERNKAY